MTVPEESLRDQIEKEAARLARLEADVEASKVRLKELRARPPTLESPSACAPPLAPKGPSVRDKVSLFKSLFRGREDVFPRLWENPRKGTKGYAPACSNEWVQGVCEKPRVKCGERPNQAFIPAGDQVIEDHLRGRHVIGV